MVSRAKSVMPGGVNSPVRAFGSVAEPPLFAQRGAGALLWDVEGNELIDYIGSWGPLLFGHGYEPVVQALQDVLPLGTSFGASTVAEIEMAELICQFVPSVEMVRLVCSGTEACMSALRLARAFTKRDLIVKAAGGYHGHSDGLLVRAGSGAETLSLPDSLGVPADVAKTTLIVEYNDTQALERCFEQHGDRIAGVIIEPVAGNMGVVVPQLSYLRRLRELTRSHGAVLIFDEVMTGFRLARGGAQQRFDVMPDLTCLGKIIGGGLPLAAYGGSREIMSLVAPAGPMYQAGTLSGNPLCVAAGLAMLRALQDADPYSALEQRGMQLRSGLLEAAGEFSEPVCVNQIGSMLTVFFCEGPVTNLTSARESALDRFSSFHAALRDEGILFPPSQFESAFISAAHSDAHMDQTLEAVRSAFARVR